MRGGTATRELGYPSLRQHSDERLAGIPDAHPWEAPPVLPPYQGGGVTNDGEVYVAPPVEHGSARQQPAVLPHGHSVATDASEEERQFQEALRLSQLESQEIQVQDPAYQDGYGSQTGQGMHNGFHIAYSERGATAPPMSGGWSGHNVPAQGPVMMGGPSRGSNPERATPERVQRVLESADQSDLEYARAIRESRLAQAEGVPVGGGGGEKNEAELRRAIEESIQSKFQEAFAKDQEAVQTQSPHTIIKTNFLTLTLSLI